MFDRAGKIEKSLVGDYLRYLRLKGRAPDTLKAYQDTLSKLATVGVTRSAIEAWLDGLWARLMPASVLHHHKNARAFFNWCVAQGHLRASPMKGIPEPRVRPSVVVPFTPDQTRALFAAARTERDRALVAVLLNTGVRIGELCRLRAGDVELGRLHIMGKGGRPRWVGINASAERLLRQYMISGEHSGTRDTVFRIGRHAAYWALRRLADSSGVPGTHPHRFRDTFAVRFLENGGGVDDLQILMGHANISMTLRYVQWGREQRAIQGQWKYAPSVV